ncbi:MAG: hypothetical protein L3J28_00110 [Candidatus Polarisedimenticolaceae bacterium]|nr:hypothetical protein [Candidatus Polarisedimenticolaceae bacterium]
MMHPTPHQKPDFLVVLVLLVVIALGATVVVQYKSDVMVPNSFSPALVSR